MRHVAVVVVVGAVVRSPSSPSGGSVHLGVFFFFVPRGDDQDGSSSSSPLRFDDFARRAEEGTRPCSSCRRFWRTCSSTRGRS